MGLREYLRENRKDINRKIDNLSWPVCGVIGGIAGCVGASYFSYALGTYPKPLELVSGAAAIGTASSIFVSEHVANMTNRAIDWYVGK